MASNALTPLLSREQYRALYIQNLSQEARVNAQNLQANIDWAASGDAEQEAALNATVQAMPQAQVEAQVDQYIRALVIPRDVQFVLARITLDQKKFILTNYAKIVGDMARLNLARPTSGAQFLAVLEANYLPITKSTDANLVASQASLYATRTLAAGAPGPGVTADNTTLETPVLSITPAAVRSEDGAFGADDDDDDDTRNAVLKPKSFAGVVALQQLRGQLANYVKRSRGSTVRTQLPAPGALDDDIWAEARNEHAKILKEIQEDIGKEGEMRTNQHNDVLLGYLDKLDEHVDAGNPEPKVKDWLNQKSMNPDPDILSSVAATMLGAKKKPRGRPRKVQEGKGVRKSRSAPTFMKGGGVAVAEGPPPAEFGWQQFGKYMLARNDLENGDVFHMRYQNGKPIQRMPRKMVGSGVKAVLSSIADGKHPKFDDIEALSSSERDYVRDIMKGAALDPSGFPEGDKSEKEKMKHKFEKLKGEIVAGNDNPEIVKDFKHIILKMRQAKMLPANQVNEILLELSTLGH